MDSSRPDDITASWYERAFGELYDTIYAHRSFQDAEREVSFAAETVSLSSDDAVLDLCCGAGRHLHVLVRIVRYAVGLDYSPHLLNKARKLLPHRAALIRADMRDMPFHNGCFDVVFNFFTSLGYFLASADNQKTIQEIARVLKKGGRFFIDHMNENFIKANLIPETRRHVGSFDIREQRWIEHARVNKKIDVYYQNQLYDTVMESVQLYSTEEFRHLLELSGLRPQKWFGDYRGSPLRENYPRMIVMGEKL